MPGGGLRRGCRVGRWLRRIPLPVTRLPPVGTVLYVAHTQNRRRWRVGASAMPWSGCRDLNPGPSVPQTDKGGPENTGKAPAIAVGSVRNPNQPNPTKLNVSQPPAAWPRPGRLADVDDPTSWTIALAAMGGGLGSGIALLGGEALARRRAEIRKVRVRMYDELVPALVDAIADNDKKAVERTLKTIRRAVTVAGWRDREALEAVEDAYRSWSDASTRLRNASTRAYVQSRAEHPDDPSLEPGQRIEREGLRIERQRTLAEEAGVGKGLTSTADERWQELEPRTRQFGHWLEGRLLKPPRRQPETL